MTPEMLARLRPHLTVFTDGDPNAATHDPVVAQALAAVGEHGGDAADAAGGAAIVSVTADARGTQRSHFAMQVIVRTNGRAEGSRYDILAWHRLWGAQS
jgi:hypothetical protein